MTTDQCFEALEAADQDRELDRIRLEYIAGKIDMDDMERSIGLRLDQIADDVQAPPSLKAQKHLAKDIEADIERNAG